MDERTPDLEAYERYWQPRRNRLREWLAAAWHALAGRFGEGHRGDDRGIGEGPWLEPTLVPAGPRGPILSGAVALDPPEDDDWDGDVVAYPKLT